MKYGEIKIFNLDLDLKIFFVLGLYLGVIIYFKKVLVIVLVVVVLIDLFKVIIFLKVEIEFLVKVFL